MSHDLKKIAAAFDFRGPFVSAEPYGSGHINDTFKLTIDQGGTNTFYILQRINNNIFPNIDKLMDNIKRVTEHLRLKIMENADGNFSRETLTLIPAKDGKFFYCDENGSFWRAYIFIDGAHTYDFISDPKQAYEAARAFGTFQKHLADLPGEPLFESIPFFHDTPNRFEKFLASLKADKLNRASLAKKEIEFALARKDKISYVVEGLKSGEIPSRVTHNDTKINNVMLDDKTGVGLCVIDLDTVMPGSLLYDFGDQIRTSTATAAEDERDLSKVNFRLDLFKALVEGYLNAASDMLVPAEKAHLADCGALITFEIGLRFLTDFLDGDVYFKVHRDGHNLDRTRTQFEMVRQMDEQLDKMVELVEKA